MYSSETHTHLEGFIIKWTLVLTFAGVVLIFVTKVIGLSLLYVTSGKLVVDIGKYIVQALKAMIFGG